MSEIDREAEPFRWCVYCDADCDVDEPDHAEECPSRTGVYQVRYESMHRPCEHCGKRPDPSMRCSGCDCLLSLGDSYAHRQVVAPRDDPALSKFEAAGVYEVVCLGCAAQEALS